MCVYLRGRRRGVKLFLSSPSLSHDQFDLFGLSEFLPWHVYACSRVQLSHCFFFPPINLWQQRIRLKRDLLLSLPSFLVFLAIVCYLLSIGLTLVHSSLAFCQTWFLTAAFSLFFPSSSSSAAMQFLSSHPPLLGCMWAQQKDSPRVALCRFFRALSSFSSPPFHLSVSLSAPVCLARNPSVRN